MAHVLACHNDPNAPATKVRARDAPPLLPSPPPTVGQLLRREAWRRASVFRGSASGVEVAALDAMAAALALTPLPDEPATTSETNERDGGDAARTGPASGIACDAAAEALCALLRAAFFTVTGRALPPLAALGLPPGAPGAAPALRLPWPSSPGAPTSAIVDAVGLHWHFAEIAIAAAAPVPPAASSGCSSLAAAAAAGGSAGATRRPSAGPGSVAAAAALPAAARMASDLFATALPALRFPAAADAAAFRALAAAAAHAPFPSARGGVRPLLRLLLASLAASDSGADGGSDGAAAAALAALVDSEPESPGAPEASPGVATPADDKTSEAAAAPVPPRGRFAASAAVAAIIAAQAVSVQAITAANGGTPANRCGPPVDVPKLFARFWRRSALPALTAAWTALVNATPPPAEREDADSAPAAWSPALRERRAAALAALRRQREDACRRPFRAPLAVVDAESEPPSATAAGSETTAPAVAAAPPLPRLPSSAPRVTAGRGAVPGSCGWLAFGDHGTTPEAVAALAAGVATFVRRSAAPPSVRPAGARGDAKEEDKRETPAAAAAAATPVGAVLVLGDNFYPRGVPHPTHADFWRRFATPFLHAHAAELASLPFKIVLGNHDHGGDAAAQVAFTVSALNPAHGAWQMCGDDGEPRPFYKFAMPIAPLAESPETGATAALDAKGADASARELSVDFFALDTSAASYAHRGESHLRAGFDAGRAWLARALPASRALWRVVFGHHPLYTNGRGHGPEAVCLRRPSCADRRGREQPGLDLEAVLTAGGCDAYFAGHEHVFQHYCPRVGSQYKEGCEGSGASSGRDGTLHVCCGMSVASVYWQGEHDAPDPPVDRAVLGPTGFVAAAVSCDVAAQTTTLTVRFIDGQDGTTVIAETSKTKPLPDVLLPFVAV